MEVRYNGVKNSDKVSGNSWTTCPNFKELEQVLTSTLTTEPRNLGDIEEVESEEPVKEERKYKMEEVIWQQNKELPHSGIVQALWHEYNLWNC